MKLICRTGLGACLVAFMVVAASRDLCAAQPNAETLQAQQYTATVKVIEIRNGNPRTTLAMPKVVFAAGQHAEILVGDDARKIEINISSSSKNGAVNHLADVKIIAVPSSKNPKIIATSKMVLQVGKTATFELRDTLVIEATVEQAADTPE